MSYRGCLVTQLIPWLSWGVGGVRSRSLCGPLRGAGVSSVHKHLSAVGGAGTRPKLWLGEPRRAIVRPEGVGPVPGGGDSE